MDCDSVIRIENANYDKVFYFIDKILSETDRYCQCKRCRMDSGALALNTLPPHYCIKPSGKGKAEELGSPWVLIELAVQEAMERIYLSPHHQVSEFHSAESSMSAEL